MFRGSWFEGPLQTSVYSENVQDEFMGPIINLLEEQEEAGGGVQNQEKIPPSGMIKTVGKFKMINNNPHWGTSPIVNFLGKERAGSN